MNVYPNSEAPGYINSVERSGQPGSWYVLWHGIVARTNRIISARSTGSYVLTQDPGGRYIDFLDEADATAALFSLAEGLEWDAVRPALVLSSDIAYDPSSVRDRMVEALVARCPVERVAKAIDEGMDATRTIFTESGQVIEPDHAARVRYIAQYISLTVGTARQAPVPKEGEKKRLSLDELLADPIVVQVLEQELARRKSLP